MVIRFDVIPSRVMLVGHSTSPCARPLNYRITVLEKEKVIPQTLSRADAPLEAA